VAGLDLLGRDLSTGGLAALIVDTFGRLIISGGWLPRTGLHESLRNDHPGLLSIYPIYQMSNRLITLGYKALPQMLVARFIGDE
jgi:hypothetical protein